MSLILRVWTAWKRNETKTYAVIENKREGVRRLQTKIETRKCTQYSRETKALAVKEFGIPWPPLEAHLGWGVSLWQDASIPSVSLFKSPKQGADVSRGLALPLASLETWLNRWGGQQVQDSAQTSLFFPRASPYVCSALRLPFSCPSVVHAPLCCLKLRPWRPHFHKHWVGDGPLCTVCEVVVLNIKGMHLLLSKETCSLCVLSRTSPWPLCF